MASPAPTLKSRVYVGGTLGLEWTTVRELVDTLRANYCGPVGLEYMHIADVEERRFLQDRMEGKDAAIQFTPEGKKAILAKVIEAEQYEKFLGRKYVGTKRFGLDGGEAMIPALEAVIKYGGSLWRARNRLRHAASRPAERPRQCDGQALPRHLPRIFAGGSVQPR